MRLCSSHRYLAIRRGEKEGFLKVRIEVDDDGIGERLCRLFLRPTASIGEKELVARAVKDGYKRLIKPSVENEVCVAVKDRSDDTAIQTFADNVKQLLMAPPLPGVRVLGMDPGFKSGCKLAVVDENGNLLAHDVIYPMPPVNHVEGAEMVLGELVKEYEIDALAVGNGTAGRETEHFVRQLKFCRPVSVYMVSEAGASVYSASETGRREFPDEDETVRGAVSIARRLQDPLAELVKIEPKSIGVGQYQHDVDQSKLQDSLDFVVSGCVNAVGVNVNTASRELLSYISGIGPALAGEIVKYREKTGSFRNREELKKVAKIGVKTFQQCAGFLRIKDGDNPLDSSGIHPEQYDLVQRIAADHGLSIRKLMDSPQLIRQMDIQPYIEGKVGLPTLTDIIIELEKPGLDPRGEAEKPVFEESVRTLDDLRIGQVLPGVVTNITAFGAFVDIGLKENGLVHISQLCDHFVKSPSQVVSVGQVVKVKILDVDKNRRRIALTMKDLEGNERI